jgi:predicted transglutaminase-like protease
MENFDGIKQFQGITPFNEFYFSVTMAIAKEGPCRGYSLKDISFDDDLITKVSPLHIEVVINTTH